MAAVEEHRPGKYRVRYSLRVPGKLIRRYRYAPSRAQANALERQLTFLEHAVRAGAAPVGDIDEWVNRSWISHGEARAAFRAYRAHSDQAGPSVAVDLPVLRSAYERYALEHSKARDASRKSHRNHMGMADQILAWLAASHPDLALTTADISGWLSALANQGYSDWSRHHYLQKLRILIDLAVEAGMARANPARDVRRGPPKRQAARAILSPADAQRLLAASSAHRARINGGLPTVVRLGLYAGLRPEEMCWLTWGAIDLARRLIYVQETVDLKGLRWRPKDAEMRVIDVKQGMVDHLIEERQRQAGAGLLGHFVLVAGHARMTQYRGQAVGSDAVQRAFVAMARAEGLDRRITLYSLRHTYCTSLLRAGIDIETVRERMGHSDIRTTQGYLHALKPEAHPSDALPY